MKKKEERLFDGWKLVTDSGCGLLVPEDADIDHEVVPFTISVDDMDYMDGDDMDTGDMLEHIENSQSGGRTSCPSPHAWLEAWGMLAMCLHLHCRLRCPAATTVP